ncbi:MAG: c-type cytochrome [Chitinophagaceae bacterium]|nr:MAG: c-type cytochrome [Chitinophagaceae bacterium]
MGFPGEIFARNITPAGIGGWSDGEILRAVVSGVSKDGHALFPIMNYHRFGHMDREDVNSIIAYIKSLKPVKQDIQPSKLDFPVNILVHTFPSEPEYVAIPPKSDKVQYGKYLVNAAGCVDCHSKTDKGNVIAGTEFGGGMVFTQPGGTVTTPNITPHETGIGSWSREAFVQRFKAFDPSVYKAAKLTPKDLNTPMPWTMYAGMSEEDLSAIYAYLKSLDGINNKVVTFKKA